MSDFDEASGATDWRETIFDRLVARSNIPELEPFHLAQNWRADEVRDPSNYCTTCRWNGSWDDMSWHKAFMPRNGYGGITTTLLEQSSAAGNLCCAVLLALARKFDSDNVAFELFWGPVTSKGNMDVNHIYLYRDGGHADAPPGATTYLQGRHPNVDPKSDEALSWAQKQIHDCICFHDCSGLQSQTRDLPTRLIYVPENVSNGCIRLVTDTTSLPPRTSYTALTHCWGDFEPQCLTTVENIDAYSTEGQGIPWETIPQTFRDAMQYTRRLGLEYIWIDAICVMQKDDSDWEKESTRMFDYYSNAHVTLGTTLGADDTAGFFSERHVQASSLYLFDVIFKGEKLGVYAKRTVNETAQLNNYYASHAMTHYDNGGCPLFERAWAYQERLVSPRLLLFTPSQLFHECYADQRLHDSQQEGQPRTLKTTYGQLLQSGEQQDQEGFYDGDGKTSWRHLVAMFNALKLSFATDKLPAFAAVAQHNSSRQVLAHAPEEEYLCGLRKGHLHHDLLWKAVGRSGLEGKGSEGTFTRSTSSYLAPSWSWASVPRLAEYDSYWFKPGGQQSTIVLEGEHLTFTQGGRFGRALGGYITIRGPVLECVLSPSSWRKGDNLHCGGQELKLRDGRETTFFSFLPDFERGYKELEASVDDGSPASSSEVVIYLLQTCASELGSGYLALLWNSESQRYYRLGVGFRERLDREPVEQTLHEHFRNAEQGALEIEWINDEYISDRASV
ncbi:hypothetical protein E8E14_003032 [Neopestalotiopsis sp. 37M]|nr:hypothetical protein E8E14_003032 [Neopestalotiopsis sp. 37M]